MVEATADVARDTGPTFQRGDPLKRWSLIFLIVGIGVTVWLVALFAVMAADLTETRDRLLLGQDQWVIVTTMALIGSILGLIFVIVGRVGGTQGGSYLSADLDAEERARNFAAARNVEQDTSELPAAVAGEVDLLRSARIVDPFGADGKILLAYDVPADGGPGVYGDVLIRVDSDATLNVRTRLARLKPRS